MVLFLQKEFKSIQAHIFRTFTFQFLTNNFLLQNKESAEEMKSLFYRNEFNLKFSVVRESLRKYVKGYENKKLVKKNIKRSFTIISSHEFNELPIICFRIIKFLNDRPAYHNNEKIVLYIRLHPTLNPKKLNQIIRFCKRK